MIQALRKLPNLAFLTGMLFVLLALGGWLMDNRRSDADLIADVEQNMQADFLEAVEETVQRSREIAKEFKEDKQLEVSDDNVVRLVLDANCRIVQWSNSELLPSSRILHDLCDFPNFRTLPDRNKLYYYFRHQIPGFTVVTLMPLQIGYKVTNDFLPPYVFLGRYTDDAFVQRHLREFDLDLRQVPGAVRIFDEQENFVFSLTMPNPGVFGYGYRTRVLILALLGLLLIAVAGYRWCRKRSLRVGNLKIPAVFLYVLGLFAFRMMIFWLGLPGNYVPTDLFSPIILAIGSWSPSLGDLIINVVLLLAGIWMLIREFRRRISVFYRWALNRETVAWTVQCVVLTVCGLFTWWFFELVDNIVEHSTIYFEFQNIFELNGYSLLAFAVLGAVLVGLELILLEMLRFSFHFFRGPGRIFKVLLSLGWLTALSFLLFGLKPAYLISVPVVFTLSLLIFVRTTRTLVFKLDLLNFLLVIFIFSLLTTIGLEKGNAVREKVQMELVADRQSDDHDLITESLFDRVVREVEAESFLLDYSQINGLAQRLQERFFNSSFKGYEVRIFLYNEDLELQDKTGDYRPYIYPDSDPSLNQLGRTTMTDSLYMVKYYKGLFESIYIGKFNLLLRSLGNILVWVELLPTEIQSNRLYPQLLLDDNVRMKATLSNKFEYAVYRENRLFRKHSNEPFPIFYTGPPELDSLRYLYQQGGKYDHVFYRASEDKVVHVRSPGRSFLDSANTFSFIFYFFILAAIVLMLPVWLVRIFRNPNMVRYLSLKARIQVFFLSFSVLPLFVVVFLLSPYIRDHIFSDLKADLALQTQQVANQLREDYLRLRRNQSSYSAIHSSVKKKIRRALEDKIHDIEKTVGNDINIYYNTGKLHLSTQPSIYELGLTSEYMNPRVYSQIRTGRISDVVIEDKIGAITYFSGFYPILNDNRKIIGFLNLPYFKNQDQVNEQSLSLLTLLVNIYVFIFLAIGVIAVLISNSIIRPLAILSRKLEDTTLGRQNEPIKWDSQDEIGEIIRSYNQMLEKLAESEEKLAKTQREAAWQEMARQVAHEIKNPLTPMRLNLQHLVRTWNRDKPENDKLNRMFAKVTNTILVQIESLVNIANSFSQFAKMPEPQKSTFDLNRVIQEVADLYGAEKAVQLNVDIPSEEFSVHSDRDQLSRVFNNLVKNAIQAIEHDHGRVDIRMKFGEETAIVEIQDNGKGIPDEIGKRIFEPKFSTKSSGMGLGLAIVKKIVETVAGGKIYFESEEGTGTTFYVELPRAN
jgi:two-component system nitrogen regulation sensor histidine kinase NtrY